jgi:hypothetical protein
VTPLTGPGWLLITPRSGSPRTANENDLASVRQASRQPGWATKVSLMKSPEPSCVSRISGEDEGLGVIDSDATAGTVDGDTATATDGDGVPVDSAGGAALVPSHVPIKMPATAATTRIAVTPDRGRLTGASEVTNVTAGRVCRWIDLHRVG